MRPCKAGMCLYESVKDGTLDLYDITVMNDVIDLEQENERLYLEHKKRHGDK